MTAAIRFKRICLAQITAGNAGWVTALRDKALAQIANGKGHLSVLTSASLNGKSFDRSILLTALEEADICQEALDDGSSAESVTVPDFSR